MSSRSQLRLRLALFSIVLHGALAGCSIKVKETGAPASGNLTIDGSSTVYPITQAVAEEFKKSRPDVRWTVGVAGTGGGFKRFVRDDLDICDASRPIEQSERDDCEKNGVKFVELKIAIDGLSIVVNEKNTWCKSLSVDQLRRLWVKESKIRNWRELDPSFPDKNIVLYGPDTDSGTFDYFTEVICGQKGNSRQDYQPSSDDNVLIQGVKGDAGALGYFGYAYYVLNKKAIRALPIAAGDKTEEGVTPSNETILNGKYKPLSRPLFLYVNKRSLKRPEVLAFVNFYLERGPELVKDVHYIPLPAAVYAESTARLNEAIKSE